MRSEDANICMGRDNIQCASTNISIYLGHTIRLGEGNQHVEVTSRIRLAWTAFGSLGFILKNTAIPINLQCKDYNTHAGANPWTKNDMPHTRLANKLLTAQRAMEQYMLGVSLRDTILNEKIRKRDVICNHGSHKDEMVGFGT